MTKARSAWIAGFYEGEGSISINRCGRYKKLAVQVVQCEHECPEALLRIAKWTKLGTIYGPYLNNGSFKTKLPSKPKWIWTVTGERDVEIFVDQIWSWLSIRRQEQIESVLDNWADYRATLQYPK